MSYSSCFPGLTIGLVPSALAIPYTIPTTVRDAMTIHGYGTDLYDGYFMEDEEYPNAEQELNDIYDTLFPNA